MDNVTALAPRAVITDEQRDLIKRTVAPDASNDELALFLHAAAKAGLDPLQKQIWFVKRSGRVTIQAGVDGLQARALRMPDCEGISSAVVYEKEDFQFDKAKGEVVRHLSNPFGSNGRLVGAWGIVRRKGKAPFVALIQYGEYADNNSPLWKNKPAVMLEKVARSTALRRAYPEDFGGIYDPAEMGRDAAPEASEPAETPRAAPAVEVLPPAGKIEAPAPEAAKVVETPKSSAPAPHVMALWEKWVKTQGGNKKLAKTGWDEAAAQAGVPGLSSGWSVEDAKKVEAVLYPTDIPF